MLLYLIVLFTAVPLIELALLIKVGTILGVTNTILLVVLTGIIGATLARMQGFRVLLKIQENLAAGILPAQELFDGLLILIAGFLLITPGLLTDALGFALLIPLSRFYLKRWLVAKAREAIDRGEVRFTFFHRY